MKQDRPLVFNFFVMNTPGHINPGVWREPGSRALDYNDLDMWVDLAKLAEAGMVDAIFFADVFGMYGDYKDAWQPLAEHAVQFPVSDPGMLISAMAHATENLGFIYTKSILQQHPFAFAREISTLDHLTKGRVGWNIVTSASANGSRSMGLPDIVDHDERYRWAEEYLEVLYKLWEASWDDGAVIADRTGGRYIDASHLHKIFHVGERYQVEGPHLVEPSPQRTPLLVQAGSSPAGMEFAARHAEGAFLLSGRPERSSPKVRDLIEKAGQHGRTADDILPIEAVALVVGSTMEEAQRKLREIEAWEDEEAQIMLRWGAAGVGLAGLPADTPLRDVVDTLPGMRSGIQGVIDQAPPGKVATVADLFTLTTSRAVTICGTPETIADEIEAFAATGVRGFNLVYKSLFGTFSDFVEHVAPVLQARGLMQREYSAGTLREKMFPGRGASLPGNHPGRAYRGSLAQGSGSAS